MGQLFGFAIILLIAISTKVNFSVQRKMSTVSRAFEDYYIVPDVVPNAPVCEVKVHYPSGVEAKLGNELTPTLVKDEPSVYWNSNPGKYYILAMIDPDVPSRKEPKLREFNHWLVGNIPGSNVTAGETLSEHIAAAPPPGTGLHRYVFLVYQQPEKLTFDEHRLTNSYADNRPGFSIAKFAAKYNLGDPVSGNFYQAQYDVNVPVIFEKLGVKM
ncbi:unnamed protein product [Euphydryas editha]|uniref:Phosphatidylethanolamine-binding protein n=1 Tax=Euphydryas editha TaxID=104508 RepID=A0AAU9U560_EUPED|nr:unnamed protein product [Euphydryas editha]